MLVVTSSSSTLQEEKAVAEGFLHILPDVFSNQIGQLVSILYEKQKKSQVNYQSNIRNSTKYLAGSGNADRSAPIVVEHRHLVSQLLQVVRLHPSIVNNHEVSRGNRSLIHVLAHEEIIPPVTASHGVVNHSSR